MGKKNKVALMLVITLLFNIFYTSNVFATNLNTNILSVLKINSMITDINSVVNLSANDEVELDIKYTNSNKNIQAGDEVNIDLPLNFKNVKIAYGGKERQDSVYNGLKLLDEKCDVVLIHDGARPFVSDKIIDKSIEEAKEHKAIVVGVPVKDTIKVIDNDKNIVDTPNRSVLWAVQTPQTFDYNILIDAYKDAFKNKFYGTDDAMLVERIGYKVKMLEGSYNNIKITTQEDLNIGSQILRVQD